MSAPDNIKPPLKDRLIPWYFVMAFMVVFAVNGVFVTLALQHNSGVVTENPYEKGLAYNRTIKQADAQASLGWKSKLLYENGLLTLHLHDKLGAAITGASANIHISRPLEKGHAFTLTLQEEQDGIYRAAADFALAGQWQTTVNILWHTQHYQHSQRLVVR